MTYDHQRWQETRTLDRIADRVWHALQRARRCAGTVVEITPDHRYDDVTITVLFRDRDGLHVAVHEGGRTVMCINRGRPDGALLVSDAASAGSPCVKPRGDYAQAVVAAVRGTFIPPADPRFRTAGCIDGEGDHDDA